MAEDHELSETERRGEIKGVLRQGGELARARRRGGAKARRPKST
jgi:hypothetical protein